MNFINMITFLANEEKDISLGNGALVALVSILVVFAILALIIGLTTISTYLEKKIALMDKKSKGTKVSESNVQAHQDVEEAKGALDINDEDMVAAVLVASIDYRNEIKKDVHLVSVKEIK